MEGPTAPEAPAKLKAASIEVKAARLGAEGVTIDRVRIGPNTRQVVIERALAVQSGWLNHQVNEYAFTMPDAKVSVDRLLAGNRRLERSFANLVADPESSRANHVFRNSLPGGRTPWSGGRVRLAGLGGPHAVRISAHADQPGSIVLDGVRGAQIGILNTQHNEFRCRVEGATFHPESVLRDSPGLARDLALAARAPGNRALQRSFARHLNGECSSSSWPVRDARSWYADAPKVVSSSGVGVQVGHLNTRVDTAHLATGTMTVVGWSGAKVPDPGRDHRLWQGHVDRVSMSRPSALAAERMTVAGLHAADVNRAREGFLPQVIERAAAASLGRIAPGRAYLSSRMASEFITGLEQLDPVESGLSPRPGETGVPHPGAFLEFRPEEGLRAADRPYVELVEFAGQEPVLRPQGGVAAAAATAVHVLGTPAPGRSPATRLPGGGIVTTGAVVCGPAVAIAAAMGVRILDAHVLLTYVRQRVWHGMYDKWYRSALPAIRAVEALQVVVFLDPDRGRGLWVDVDPARQAAAASLLIEMDVSAGLPGRFRFLRR